MKNLAILILLLSCLAGSCQLEGTQTGAALNEMPRLLSMSSKIGTDSQTAPEEDNTAEQTPPAVIRAVLSPSLSSIQQINQSN